MKFRIRNGAVTLNGNTILEEINIDINDKDRIGIVGKNGTGKTTLVKAIIDNSMLEEGIGEEKFELTKIGSFNVGYLDQITLDDLDITLYQELLKSFKMIIDMENRLNNLVEEMNNNASIDVISKYTDLENQFRNLGGYTYKKEIEVMLNKFKFSESDKNKKISEFSGGQRTKIAFMKLLLQKPDLLILDEPTNHLDIETIIWLEDYLKNYSKSLILISHDREFLNNIVNIIYDIDYGKTVKYVGNYENFEKEKNIRFNNLMNDYLEQQKEIKKLRTIYERFRYKPKKAGLAMSRLHQLEKMDIIDKPNKEDLRSFKINLDSITKTGRVALTVNDLVIGYDKPLCKINFELESGRKLGIIGKNGTGKSTFLKTINELIPKISGEYKYGVNAKVGYFDQSLVFNSKDNTIFDEFHNTYPNLSNEEVRSALGAFLFKGEDVFKKIEVLSGGEKVRLELCKILYNKPNILLLDEPTNHMDIISKENLENILNDYKGTVIFVSHDRYFVRKLSTELLIFNDFNVEYFPYTYDEYIEKEKNKEEIIIERNIKKTRKESNNKEIRNLEKKIEKLEIEIKKLEESLLTEEVYLDHNKASEINIKLKNKQKELDELNNDWFRLVGD